MIPKYDPTYSYRDLIASFRNSSKGDTNEELCSKLKDIYSVKYSFVFNSARIALFALLKAYNHPGGVLMPAYTCIVVPQAVECAGYQIEFADIDLNCLNVTRETLERAITPNTTVIMATHLFGIPCNIDEVRNFGQKHELLIVEDAAPAMGAIYQGKPVCSFGDASILSFQATKVISGEDGGALLTNNAELAEKIDRLMETAQTPTSRYFLFAKGLARKAILNHWIYSLVLWAYRLLGKETMYEVVHVKPENPETFFVSCSPFSSALILGQLEKLPTNLDRRRTLAQIYAKELHNCPEITIPALVENDSPAWIQFPFLVRDKLHFYKYMQKHGIDMSWTYRYSCAESYYKGDFPQSKRAAQTVLGLPTYPSLTDDDARKICTIVKGYAS